MLNNCLIFGGTFDPVHNGHLLTAVNVQRYFKFDLFNFLPCKIPVLKNHIPRSDAHRLKMLELAIEDYPEEYHFKIDAHEINRDSPSFMVTTLEHYRHQLGLDVAITLLIGMDAFAELPLWHEWERILTLSNLLVIDRPLSSHGLFSDVLEADFEKILTTPLGLVARFNAGSYPISSTMIREKLKNHEDVTDDVPDPVLNYIHQYKLYE